MTASALNTGSWRPLFATQVTGTALAPDVMCFVRFRHANGGRYAIACTAPRIVATTRGLVLTAEPLRPGGRAMYDRLIPGGFPTEIPIEAIVEAWARPRGAESLDARMRCPEG